MTKGLECGSTQLGVPANTTRRLAAPRRLRSVCWPSSRVPVQAAECGRACLSGLVTQYVDALVARVRPVCR